MKRVFAAALFLVLLFFLLPTILVGDTPPASALPDATPPAASSPSPSDGAASLDQQVSIRLQKEDGTVETISMDKYLLGVVAAEMPAAFEVEALKAQAVLRRSTDPATGRLCPIRRRRPGSQTAPGCPP